MNQYVTGTTIKELREKNKITQVQLAERLGVQKSVISYYESGSRFPSYDVLIRFARLFHVSTDYLLGLERNRNLDVTGLTEEDIDVLITVANALRKKK